MSTSEQQMSLPVRIAMGLIGVVGFLVLTVDPDLGFVFLAILMPLSTYAIWEQQRIGFFTRDEEPYLFWFVIALGCATSLAMVLYGIMEFIPYP